MKGGILGKFTLARERPATLARCSTFRGERRGLVPRYHFDIRVGDCLIEDNDGTELADRDEAFVYALEEIRELMTTRAGGKFDPAQSRVEVADDHKRLLFAVPFPAALQGAASKPAWQTSERGPAPLSLP